MCPVRIALQVVLNKKGRFDKPGFKITTLYKTS